jgi:hypothetical protein
VVSNANAFIYERIDLALERGRRSEQLVIGLSVLVFALGMGLIAVGAALNSVLIVGPSVAIEALLYWPIRQVLRIRKQNIALACAPALIATLPPEQAAAEMVKLLEDVRDAE